MIRLDSNERPTPLDELLKASEEMEKLKNMYETNEETELTREKVELFSRIAREGFYKRIPIINRVYSSGKYDGKQDGYVQASKEYEKKLLEQADQFLAQKKIFENQKDQYDALLVEYEQYIQEMEARDSLTNEEETQLNQILLTERKLKKIHPVK